MNVSIPCVSNRLCPLLSFHAPHLLLPHPHYADLSSEILANDSDFFFCSFEYQKIPANKKKQAQYSDGGRSHFLSVAYVTLCGHYCNRRAYSAQKGSGAAANKRIRGLQALLAKRKCLFCESLHGFKQHLYINRFRNVSVHSGFFTIATSFYNLPFSFFSKTQYPRRITHTKTDMISTAVIPKAYLLI